MNLLSEISVQEQHPVLIEENDARELLNLHHNPDLNCATSQVLSEKKLEAEAFTHLHCLICPGLRCTQHEARYSLLYGRIGLGSQ